MSKKYDKGEKLNRIVWKLFEDAGFITEPNSDNSEERIVKLPHEDPRPIDLWAQIAELGVTIVGENKAQTKLKFKRAVEGLKKVMGHENADAGLLVVTEREKKVTKQERDLAQSNGIKVWEEQQLEYYKKLVDALDDYAKFEIIHSFGLEPKKKCPKNSVLALKFEQPHPNPKSDVELYLFTATPEELLESCVIYRRAQGRGDAYQRMVRKKKLKEVKEYLAETGSLLPNNIIVHFEEEDIKWTPLKIPEVDEDGNKIYLARPWAYKLGALDLPSKYASMEIIDGQHRLYGFVKAEPATRNNYNIIVLGITGLKIDRRRDTFVTINSTATRVNANLVAFLKYTEDEHECQKNPELMAIKIVVKLNETAPFKDKIRLLDIGKQRITLQGFSGYDLKSLVMPKGALRAYYSHKSEEYVRVLRMYFNLIKEQFAETWDDTKTYIIFTNIGISAFLKLLRSMLNTEEKPLTENVITKYLKSLKDNWKHGWETKVLRRHSTYIGSGGWIQFHKDMVKAIRKDHPKFKE